MAEASSVTIRGAKKWYGVNLAVKGIDLEIRPGELVSLLGPSGCGKTTTLRMVAGLEAPDEGEIRIAGKDVTEVPPWKRRIGMVFQSYALFPHMSVSQNIAFGLDMQKVPNAHAAAQVSKAMALVKLDGMGDRRPSQLSGGQRQRVALARAIVTQPEVLLFDEPLAALDRKLREHMQIEIRQLQLNLGITTIFVTHDQEEALTLSDRVVVMNAGEIIQVDTPNEIYQNPRSKFVADFIGTSNILHGTVQSVTGDTAAISIANGAGVSLASAELKSGDEVALCVRPEKVQINPSPGRCDVIVRGSVQNSVFVGSVFHHYVTLENGDLITVLVPNNGGSVVTQGSSLTLGWNGTDTRLLPQEAPNK